MTNRINPDLAVNILPQIPASSPEMKTVQGMQDELTHIKEQGNKLMAEASHEVEIRNVCIREALAIIELAWPYVQEKLDNLDSEDHVKHQALNHRIDVYLNGEKYE